MQRRTEPERPDRVEPVGSVADESGRPVRHADVSRDEERHIVASVTHWSAPFPPPSVLVEYNDAASNGAERLFTMIERQAYHDMAMEESDSKLALRGQFFGLAVVVLALALAGYLAYLGAYAAAAAVAGVDLVGLAAVFVYGSIRKRNAREIQVEDADVEVR